MPPPAVNQPAEEARSNRQNHVENKSEQHVSGGDASSQRKDEDDIFQGAGVNIVVNGKTGSPGSEDMEESPRDNLKQSYFTTPVFGGAVNHPAAVTEWQQQVHS